MSCRARFWPFLLIAIFLAGCGGSGPTGVNKDLDKPKTEKSTKG